MCSNIFDHLTGLLGSVGSRIYNTLRCNGKRMKARILTYNLIFIFGSQTQTSSVSSKSNRNGLGVPILSEGTRFLSQNWRGVWKSGRITQNGWTITYFGLQFPESCPAYDISGINFSNLSKGVGRCMSSLPSSGECNNYTLQTYAILKPPWISVYMDYGPFLRFL